MTKGYRGDGKAVTGHPLFDGKNIPNGALGYVVFQFSEEFEFNGGKNYIQNGMYCTTIEFQNEHNKNAYGILGTTQKAHKKTSSDGTFTIEGYDATNIWDALELNYQTNGIDEYFNTHVWEYDPTTKLGIRYTVYYGCNVDSVTTSSLNVDDDAKMLSLSGTFEWMEQPEPKMRYDELDGTKASAIFPDESDKNLDI